MGPFLLVGFLLIPPILQLWALLFALHRGFSKRNLLLASAVLAMGLIGLGALLDVGQPVKDGEAATAISDWAIGSLLGLAVFLETAIVVALVKPHSTPTQ
jgi:hypothetical protein